MSCRSSIFYARETKDGKTRDVHLYYGHDETNGLVFELSDEVTGQYIAFKMPSGMWDMVERKVIADHEKKIQG